MKGKVLVSGLLCAAISGCGSSSSSSPSSSSSTSGSVSSSQPATALTRTQVCDRFGQVREQLRLHPAGDGRARVRHSVPHIAAKLSCGGSRCRDGRRRGDAIVREPVRQPLQLPGVQRSELSCSAQHLKIGCSSRTIWGRVRPYAGLKVGGGARGSGTRAQRLPARCGDTSPWPGSFAAARASERARCSMRRAKALVRCISCDRRKRSSQCVVVGSRIALSSTRISPPT